MFDYHFNYDFEQKFTTSSCNELGKNLWSQNFEEEFYKEPNKFNITDEQS